MRHSIVLLAVPLSVALAAACSSSSGGGSSSSSDGGPDATASGPAIVCGTITCPGNDVCCFNSTSPTCQPQGGCQESYLSCSSPANCGSGKTCCFTYENDSGAVSGPFNAQCQDSCPSTSYRLCATMADCQSGEICNPATLGAVAPYCGVGFDGNFMIPGFDGNFMIPGFDGNFSQFLPDGSTATSDAGSTSDAAAASEDAPAE
jgi:hypothetical protein